MKIAILGTGAVGSALHRLATAAGHDVAWGSRTPDGARTDHADAVRDAELVVAAVPFTAAEATLSALGPLLDGRVLVDPTNPLRDDWSPLVLGAEDSAAERIARAAPGARTVKAFNTVFADVMTPEGLRRGGGAVTTFVAGDDPAAVGLVETFAGSLGFDPVVAGPLAVARHLESMAHLNIAIALGQSRGTDAALLYRGGRDA